MPDDSCLVQVTQALQLQGTGREAGKAARRGQGRAGRRSCAPAGGQARHPPVCEDVQLLPQQADVAARVRPLRVRQHPLVTLVAEHRAVGQVHAQGV